MKIVFLKNLLLWNININEINNCIYLILWLGLYEDCGVFERFMKLDEEFFGVNIIFYKIGKFLEVCICYY